jgi:hypothetical protein
MAAAQQVRNQSPRKDENVSRRAGEQSLFHCADSTKVGIDISARSGFEIGNQGVDKSVRSATAHDHNPHQDLLRASEQ